MAGSGGAAGITPRQHDAFGATLSDITSTGHSRQCRVAPATAVWHANGSITVRSFAEYGYEPEPGKGGRALRKVDGLAQGGQSYIRLIAVTCNANGSSVRWSR
eukprot:549091-Prymnesium_polylepis.2